MAKRKKKINKKPKGNRTIDHIRNSAGSMEVNPPDDDSSITGMLTIDDQLHIVKERGVYHVKLADEIDPERKNKDVPNTIQRVLEMGSNAELVGKTLLTAEKLFKAQYLPKNVDCARAMSHSLAITKDLVSMSMAASRFRRKQEQTFSAGKVTRRKDGSVLLPDVGEVETECKAFLQKAGHVQRELLEVVKLFYPDQKFKKWFDSLKNVISKIAEKDDDFVSFLSTALPLLRFVRNARNCVEHPKEDQYVNVTDFFVNAKGQLVEPTVEVNHPATPQAAISVCHFMAEVTDQLAVVVEVMFAFLCGRHVVAAPAFQFIVFMVPENKRSNKHVRFGYGTYIDNKLVPVG